MTPEQYVTRIRELVEQREYTAALDLADRHGAEVEQQLSREQWGLLGGLLEHAEVMEAARESGPVAPTPR